MPADLRKQRAALAEFGAFVFRCDDLEDLLNSACELVSETIGVGLAKILEHRLERKDLLIRAGVGWAPDVIGRVSFADHRHSPAGHALMTTAPVISPNLDAEDRFGIPDVLRDHGVRSMVNVPIAGGDRPFGVLEADAREANAFTEDDIDFLRNCANLVAAAIDRIRRNDELAARAREKEIIAHELSHRVTNLLGLVQAIASQTPVKGRSADAFRNAFLGRLQALATAERLVFRDAGEAVRLREMAEEVLAPYLERGDRRVQVEGTEIALPTTTGRMVGLALHELATNASKHGALSTPDGMVSLRWGPDENDPDAVVLTWAERDGPSVSVPSTQGFGSRLLEQLVGRSIGGTAELRYGEDGLVYRLLIPRERSE